MDLDKLALLCYEECGDYHIGSIQHFNHKKFAELIVEEFVNLAKNKSESIVSEAELYDLYATDESELDKAKATAWQLLVFGQEIKKHFGVE